MRSGLRTVQDDTRKYGGEQKRFWALTKSRQPLSIDTAMKLSVIIAASEDADRSFFLTLMIPFSLVAIRL